MALSADGEETAIPMRSRYHMQPREWGQANQPRSVSVNDK